MKAAARFILLFVIFVIAFVLPSIILPIPLTQRSSATASLMLFLLLLVDLLSITYLIRRLSLWGIKLFLAVVLVFFGLQTLMTQIETWYFRKAMPAINDEVLMKLFVNPLITAIIFIPVAIWILGKWRPTGNHANQQQPILKSKWKALIALSVAYVVIYFFYGHYVAWQFEAVRMFYSGSPKLHGFFEQFQITLHQHDLILPFQIARGLLWVLVGLPIALYLKGGKMEKILACIFFYSVLPSIQLIIDNPLMPTEVRMAHLLEVATSHGLFGLLIGLIFTRRNDLSGNDPTYA